MRQFCGSCSVKAECADGSGAGHFWMLASRKHAYSAAFINMELNPLIPRCLHAGLIHYQQNLDCYTASYIITYNSADPGTQV